MLSLAECVQLACVLEATARKPGNVHRFQDFADLTYTDLILSAAAIAPILDRVTERGVGVTIRDAVRQTRRFVNTNTNLGIILLLAPLAAVPRDCDIRIGVNEILDRLTVDDSQAVFEAIRLAKPGGLGNVPQQDAHGEASLPLRQVMTLAADRDLVARQYANGFRDIFETGLPALGNTQSLESAIIHCQLRLLAANPDTHIARRCGMEIAIEASRRARLVPTGAIELADFDAWLRADGHRRNPGTTADLVTASLFVALRDGRIPLPIRMTGTENLEDLKWNAITSA